MFPRRLNSAGILLPLALVLPFALTAGCSKIKIPGLAHASPAPKTPVAVASPSPLPPKIDYAAVRPNELGRIPVIMYHEVGGPPAKPKQQELVRSIAKFKEDLQFLYDNGYRPVNMSDVAYNRIDIPAGKSPVVLTFDDARATQFKLKETATTQEVDPNCAIGLMEAFHKTHPDWPMRATFYILPRSKVTAEPFGQMGMGAQKVAYIVKSGMEIGNHTMLHKSMKHMSPTELQYEIGAANNAIMDLLKDVPGAKCETLATPYGVYPAKQYWPYLLKGSYQGRPYENKLALLAAWQPIASPSDKDYDPLRLERVSPIDGATGIRWWVEQIKTAKGDKGPYISDGDPNVISYPKSLQPKVNVARLKAQNKLAYGYANALANKPIVAEGSGGGATTMEKPIQPVGTDTTPPGISTGRDASGGGAPAGGGTTAKPPVGG